MPTRPLSRDLLHEIGVRRRKDPDVQALLWEIRRLRDLLETIAAHLQELGHEEHRPTANTSIPVWKTFWKPSA